MRKNNTIQLNESMLKRIIKESVRNVLNEMSLHKTNTTRNSDPNGNDCKWNYDGDIIDRWILGIKKMHKKKVVQDLMDFLWHIGLPKIISIIALD